MLNLFWHSTNVNIRPTILELRFYGCCHPCLYITWNGEDNGNKIYYKTVFIFFSVFSFCWFFFLFFFFFLIFKRGGGGGGG